MGRLLVVLLSGVLVACAHEPQGVMMNHFIPASKLAAVRVCGTTSEQLVKLLGEPSGRGRDGEAETLTWSAAAVVNDSEQTAIGTQMVYAWIDADGLVSGFVVNPASIPQKPSACREQHPDAVPDSAPAPAAKPTDA